MLRCDKFAVFIVSELFRDNQQGRGKLSNTLLFFDKGTLKQKLYK